MGAWEDLQTYCGTTSCECGKTRVCHYCGETYKTYVGQIEWIHSISIKNPQGKKTQKKLYFCSYNCREKWKKLHNDNQI